MGRPVSQNSRGHLLGNVTDEGKTLDDPDARGYQTKNRLDFHCDQLPVDLLGLFCLRTAKSGGTSYLVSAPAVHNVLLVGKNDKQHWQSSSLFARLPTVHRPAKRRRQYQPVPWRETMVKRGQVLVKSALQTQHLPSVMLGPQPSLDQKLL